MARRTAFVLIAFAITFITSLDGQSALSDHERVHIVYAGGLNEDGRPTFYRSIDRGASWHVASAGYDSRYEPAALLVDPRDSSQLFLGSAGYGPTPYVMRLRRTAANPRT